MPKNGQTCSHISKYLEILEDTMIYTKKSRMNSFECLKTIFDEDDGKVTHAEVQRTMTNFINCLKEDFTSCPLALSAVLSLLKNVKIIPSVPVQDLLPSALAVLQMLKTLSASKGIDKLKELSYEVLLSYPVDVLSTMVTNNCSEILEIFAIPKYRKSTEMSVNAELCSFLLKLLTLLPPEQKKHFVKEGIGIWFGELMPSIMTLVAKNAIEHNMTYIECLESLTEELVNLDYSKCPRWRLLVLECICNPQKFPLVMKSQLQNGSNIWHRLWIAFVKLLKNEITNIFGKNGTPINSLLPVVEMAFKMDVPNRCRAFHCWDILIDNFSKEANENCLPKRIKLLLIPLKLNNAKTEETALVKFHTWWNFIRKFQFKLGNFTNEIMISFIHFTFGKEASNKKHAIAGAALLYDSVKKYTLQAFVEILGHANCDCKMDLPKLNGKMLNSDLLTSHWDDWIYAFKVAIEMKSIMYEKNNGSVEKQSVQNICLWRPFVVAITELPSGLMKNKLNGLIQVLIDLAKNCNTIENLQDILFSLTLSLFEDDNIRNVMLGMAEEKPLYKIMSIILNPGLHAVYERNTTEEMIKMLKPLMDLVVVSLPIKWLLDNLQPCYSSLKVWTALVCSVIESQQHNSEKVVEELLLWPVKAMHEIDVDKYGAMTWCRLYNLNLDTMPKTVLDNDILQCLTTQHEKNKTLYFKLCLTVCLLKNRLVNQKDTAVLPEILQDMTSKMNDYREYEQIVPLLVDTIVVLLNDVTTNENPTLAKVALNCVKNVLTLTTSEMKSHDNEAGDPIIFAIVNNVFNAVNLLYKITAYANANCDFFNFLIENVSSLSTESFLFKFLTSKMQSLVSNCSIDIIKSTINKSFEMLKENHNETSNHSSSTKELDKELIPPDAKKIIKRPKKKQPCIVKTVVENGEEYVVVKSNWKFNPRKLTENQKEKFQRKSGDIPALYQDLSQSQSEFELASWKTDSQDTTTSSNSKSSKSTTNGDASSILKNSECSVILPNIIENICKENEKNHSNEQATNNTIKCDTLNNVEHLSQSTPKCFKSPRMAFKDRVFQNVRNLIEKSSHKSNGNVEIVVGNELDTVPSTPVEKGKRKIDLSNSAPPLISADRPSRMKRKPKKFDDVQLFNLKKRRVSHSDITDPCSESQSYENELNISKLNENHNISGNADVDKVNMDITEEIERPSDIKMIENETVQNVPESELTVLSQTKLNKKGPDTTTVDGNKTHNNDKGKEIEQYSQDQAQDNQVNKNIETSSLNNTTSVLNTETENNNNNSVNELQLLNTPVSKIKDVPQKLSVKKSEKRRSRIEKELAIDMVEGHPYLNVQSEKRSTRKTKVDETKKRKNVSEKSSKKEIPKGNKQSQPTDDLTINHKESASTTVEGIQEICSSPTDSSTNEDAPCSEDIIESTQESTFSTISKTTKVISKRLPIVTVERIDCFEKHKYTKSQDVLQESVGEMLFAPNKSVNETIKEDIELPRNKTTEIDKNQSELTENMDTEPVAEDKMADAVIIIDDDEPPIHSENIVGPETQELAEADTQPNDPADFVEFESNDTLYKIVDDPYLPMDSNDDKSITNKAYLTNSENQQDASKLTSKLNESSQTDCTTKDTDICSPFKDDVQRKQDFLNDTLEISPIKVQSPDKEQAVQAREETSSEYLIVQLSSPVQSNGEPFDKSGSPDFFIEDKISPDKRDQSPPRTESSASSGSPSSSLSLKKNKPQALRSVGRAAHMLGLCVPDSLNTIKNTERVEPKETKKGNTIIPARRNLRELYNAVEDISENCGDNEECDNFLKLTKSLPSTDSSPSVPILKRKHIDIADEATISPASKVKRVSFHDPPVSTTVSVQKYIEPGCIKSPSSTNKRLERQLTRNSTKSPKRLENAFVKLDTILSKAVESFSEEQANSLTYDTTSLDVTPAVKVVNTSELNNTDPICPDLVNCADPIDNIAMELSSPAMKDLFIKEIEGIIGTIGDLAKMTELEVNRLCIKAPKVQVAKQVLTDYVKKTFIDAEDSNIPLVMTLGDNTVLAKEITEEIIATKPDTTCAEKQTMEIVMSDSATQTRSEIMKLAFTQTTIVSMTNTSIQTLESGYKTTSDVISSCLLEREDFVDKLGDQLDDTCIRKITEKLDTDIVIEILANKTDDSTSKLILNKLFDRQNQNVPNNEKNTIELSIVRDFLCDRFNDRDLILFCSQLLQKVYDKPA